MVVTFAFAVKLMYVVDKANMLDCSLPIYLDGHLIGGIGVSGGTVGQDVQVATAGVLALGALTSAS